MPEETKPQVAKDGGEEVKPKLNLTFMFNDLSMRIQMKINTPFKKAFSTAYERFNQNPKAVRFMYEGTRIRETETPADYDMEDGDQIDVQVEQVCTLASVDSIRDAYLFHSSVGGEPHD